MSKESRSRGVGGWRGRTARRLAVAAVLIAPATLAMAAEPVVTWETLYRWVQPFAPYTVQARGYDADGDLARVFVWKNGQPYAFNPGGNGFQNITDPNTSSDGIGSYQFTAEAADSSQVTRKIHWTVAVSDTPPPSLRWHTRPSIVFQGNTHTVRAQANDAYGRLGRVFVWRDTWPVPSSSDPWGSPFAFNGGGNGFVNVSDPNGPLDPAGHYLYQAEAADNRNVSSGFIEHLVSVIPPSSQTYWRASSEFGTAANPSPNAAWRNQYDFVDLTRAASSSIDFDDNFAALLNSERRMMPPSWWFAPWGAFRRPNDVLIASPWGLHTRPGYGAVRSFVWTRNDTRTVRVSANLGKGGGQAEGSYGDGNLLEVYKSTYGTGRVTPVYTARLVRGGSQGKIGFTTTMGPNDELIFRGTSPSGDGAYDSLDFDPEVKVVEPYRIDVPAGSSSGTIRSLLETAVAEAANRDAVEVVFASGTYRIDSLDYDDFTLRVDGGAGLASNITVRGQGTDPVTGTRLLLNDAKLRNGRQQTLLWLRNTANFTLRDLIIDIDTPHLPWLQGRVRNAVSLGGGTFQFHLELDAASRSYAAELFQDAGGLGIVLDGSLRPKPGFPDYAELVSIAPGSPGPLVTIRNTFAGAGFVANDDRLVLVRRKGGEQTILFQDTNVEPRFENIVFHATRNLAFDASGTTGLHLSRVQFRRLGGRFLAGAADGLHFKNGKRGPTVEDCYFEGLGDDGVNIHATPEAISVISPNTFTLAGAAGKLAVGEALMVYQSGGPSNFRVDVTVTGIGGDTVTVSPGVLSGYDRIVNLSRSGEGYVIRHNQFAVMRGRGLLLQSGYGLVSENLFNGTSGAPVSLEANPQSSFNEPPFPRHVLIRNNHFTNSAYSAGYGGVAIRINNPQGLGFPAFSFIDTPGNTVDGMTLRSF